MLNDTLTPDDLLPGAWTRRAKEALDALSGCATVADVADRFGSARDVAVTLLGYPVSGGHATRPVIRRIGALLTQPAGAARTAEALTFAAAASDLVDTAGIEQLLDAALRETVAYRPTGFDELQIQLASQFESAGMQRRRRLLVEAYENHRSSFRSYWGIWTDWARRYFEDDPGLPMAEVVVLTELFLLAGGAVSAWDDFESQHVWSFFDLPAEVLRLFLFFDPDAVLRLRDCPPELVDRVSAARAPGEMAVALRSLEFGNVSHLRLRLDRLGLAQQLAVAAAAGPSLAAFADRYGVDLDLDVRKRASAHTHGNIALLDHPSHAQPCWDDDFDQGEWVVVDGETVWMDQSEPEPFRIPGRTGDIDGATIHAGVDWKVSVIQDSNQLDRNADRMRNCTRRYRSALTSGDECLLVLNASDGARVNVALQLRSDQHSIGEIRGRHNRDEPRADEIKTALIEWFERRRAERRREIQLDSLERQVEDRFRRLEVRRWRERHYSKAA